MEVDKTKKSWSLTATIALAFGVLSSVVLLIFSCFEMYFHYQTERQNIVVKQQLIAREAATKVANFVQVKFSKLDSAVMIGELATAPIKEQEKILGILLGREAAFRHLVLLDPGHQELAKASRLSQSSWKTFMERFGEDLISQVMTGHRYFSSIYVDLVTSEPLVVMAVPVTDVFGDIKRLLIAELNLKFMWDLVDRLKVGDTGYAYVVDRKGNLIAYGDTARVLRGERLDDLQSVSEFIHNPMNRVDTAARICTGISGNTVVGTYVALETPDWAVMTELPIKEAYRQVMRNAMLSVCMLLVMAISAGLVGILVARRLALPLLDLTETSTRISNGDIGLQAAVRGPVEVVSLASAFNKMTQRLRTMLDMEEERSRELATEVEQRKKAQESLQESNSVLQATLESTQDGVLVIGENGQISLHNKRFSEIWSIPEDLLIKGEDRLIVDYVLPQLVDPEQFTAKINELYLSSDTSLDILHFKNGQILERFSCPLQKQSRETGRVWFFRDITERIQREESLRITQFSFDRAAVGIYRVRSDGKILEVNDKAAEILGYTKEEMSRLFIFDIDPLVDRENWEPLWKTLNEQNGLDSFETIHRSKDGRDTPVEINSNLLEYGGQQYSIAFTLDISERKRAEEELRKLRNYLSNIINSMPSSLVGVDEKGNITQWNRTVEKVTGIPADKAQGRSFSDILPWMASEVKNISKSIRSQQVIHDRKRSRLQGDGTLYEDVTIYPLVTNGVEGAVIRIDDVTDKVRLEEMMIQSEKMLSVGGLAAGMAHEINNPLAGMMQTAEVMTSRLGDNFYIPANRRAAEAAGTTMDSIQTFMNEREIPRMLDTIKESGRRVAAIVENMLSFARKSDAMVSSHSIEELLNKTLELASTDYDLKKHYDFKLINITKEYEANLPTVPCERTKIQQVLLNIFRNGAQAMQEAAVMVPRLILRARYERDRDMVCIEIEDNGPGIDEEVRKRIFEPFFTSKPVGVGTGLGLSVSYFIITENHDGEMAVESHPGKGAKFIIRLPVGGKRNECSS